MDLPSTFCLMGKMFLIRPGLRTPTAGFRPAAVKIYYILLMAGLLVGPMTSLAGPPPATQAAALPETMTGVGAKLPTLTILYPDMAPSIVPDSLPGSVHGPLAELTQRIAGKAGLALQWKGPLPRNRILVELTRGGMVCTPFVLKTAERARLFKFSAPMLPAPKWLVVTRKGMLNRLPTSSFTDLINDTSLVMAHKQGTTLGTDLDHLIDEHAARIRFIHGETSDVLRAVLKGYADYTLTTDGELSLPAQGYTADDFDMMRYPDLMDVGAGHIMCAKGVSDDIITAIDQSIAALSVTTVDGRE